MTYFEQDQISAQGLHAYLKRLVGRVYKILPLCEGGAETLGHYLESLLRELLGCRLLAESLKDDDRFVTLLSIIASLNSNHEDARAVRSDVFHAINLVKQMQAKYGEVRD